VNIGCCSARPTYPELPHWSNEWLTRVSLGSGWTTLTAITAPGDLTSDARPDVVARDSSGQLWLYPNNGAGDWSRRIDLGPGLESDDSDSLTVRDPN
jgi:hypothetical protein